MVMNAVASWNHGRRVPGSAAASRVPGRARAVRTGPTLQGRPDRTGSWVAPLTPCRTLRLMDRNGDAES
jgi:hypothetical protein